MSSSTGATLPFVYMQMISSIPNREKDVIIETTYTKDSTSSSGDYDSTRRITCDWRVLQESCEFFSTRLSPTWAVDHANVLDSVYRDRETAFKGCPAFRDIPLKPIAAIVDLRDEKHLIVWDVLRYLHPPHSLPFTMDNWQAVMKLADKLGIAELQDCGKVYIDAVVLKRDAVSVLEWAWRTRSPEHFAASAAKLLRKGLVATNPSFTDLPAQLQLKMDCKTTEYMLQAFRFVASSNQILATRECCGRLNAPSVAFWDQWCVAVKVVSERPCPETIQALLDVADMDGRGDLACDCFNKIVNSHRQALMTPLTLTLDEVPAYVP